ncbi:hypothetical protein AB0B31_09490 [Catellatospora citrea]|uniref:hypothetical protein n=1 Tax=Catellatospora citrea TaxID=53366 RepID=UPI0033F635D4
MTRTTMGWSAVLLGIALSVGGCTGAQERPAGTAVAVPNASPSAAAGPSCAAEMPEPEAGLLQVRQVWPKTSSVVNSFRRVDLSEPACKRAAGATDSVIPRCDRPFPWIDADAARTDATLGATGVRRVLSGVIRGHGETPADKPVEPQEIRQLVLVMEESVRAGDHLVARAAQTCGKAVTAGVAGNMYRFSVRSTAVDGQIAAFLVATGNKLIWLEFDEHNWHESDYRRVIDLAVKKVNDL